MDRKNSRTELDTYVCRGGESMGPVGAVAPTGIFENFFYIKVLEVFTIVVST